MALPILDGNQTAATLSTVLTSGEHIPAHTVVSLGSQAITDVRSAVSGSVVSISNFPSTQTIAGTVTVGTIVNCSVEAAEIIAEGIRTFGDVLISGTVTANVTNSVTVGAIIGPIGGSVFKGNSGSVESIRALPYFSQSGVANYNELSTSNPFPVAGTVTVGNSVTIGSLPAISGTVTANTNFEAEIGGPSQPNNGVQISFYDSSQSEFKAVADSTPLPISGTVTANVGGIASGVTLPVRLFAEREGTAPTGEDTLVVCNSGGRLLVDATASGASVVDYDGQAFVRVKMTSASSVTIGSLPSGALTTRFGSVATANLAFITSAVTNASRKYLLAQNISAGTVTIGIGFSPTTTQGIQLTAGGGLTFDAFCPTGAVFWLGAVTGAAFTILEG